MTVPTRGVPPRGGRRRDRVTGPPVVVPGAGGPRPPAGPTPARRGSEPWLLTAVAMAVAVLFAAPLGYVAWRNLTLGSDLWGVLTDADTLRPLRATLTLASATAAAAAVVGVALAWVTVRTDVPARRLLRTLAPLPLVFPSFVGAIALLAGIAPGGLVAEALAPLGVERMPRIDGFWGAWLVLTLFTYPYVFLPVAARLGQLRPSLEESARLLGRSPPAVFASVVVPQIAGATAAGTLLVFLYAVSDFGAVQLMRYPTLTQTIFVTQLADRARSMALSAVLAAVALSVVAAERTLSRRRIRTEAPGGARVVRYPLGRWRLPVLAVTVLFLVNALGGPLSVLAWWAVRGARLGQPLGLDGLGVATLNTAVVSVVAAVVAVAAVLPVAYLTARHRSRLAGVANALVVAGFALPGLVIALSIVFWVLNVPVGALARLYQTLPLLIAAYVIHFGAQAVRAATVAVGGVPVRLEDAARVLGAGRIRRLVTVELPLAAPGLLAGCGLVLLSTAKELPATLLLRPTGFDTLATRIWNAAEDGFLAETGLASVVLVALSGVLTWALVVRRADAT